MVWEIILQYFPTSANFLEKEKPAKRLNTFHDFFLLRSRMRENLWFACFLATFDICCEAAGRDGRALSFESMFWFGFAVWFGPVRRVFFSMKLANHNWCGQQFAASGFFFCSNAHAGVLSLRRRVSRVRSCTIVVHFDTSPGFIQRHRWARLSNAWSGFALIPNWL